jgi:hypothetical protein
MTTDHTVLVMGVGSTVIPSALAASQVGYKRRFDQ